MRRPTAGLRSARCRESVRNGRGSRGSGPASRRNPRCERPARARSGACATAAYSTDWPKRAFELPIPDRFPAVFVRIHTLTDGPDTGFLTIYAVDLKLIQPAYLQLPTHAATMAMCSNIIDCGRVIVSQTSVTTAGNTFTFLLAHGFDQAFRLDQPFLFGWESAAGTVTVPSAVDEFRLFSNDFE